MTIEHACTVLVRGLSVVAALAVTAMSAVAQPLATYQFTTGPTTFGVALPEGAATSGLQVGMLTTQTDVKTKWPDGSIRFAVVSAQIPSSGSYPLTSGTASSGTVTRNWPALVLELVINGVKWTASPGAVSAAQSTWLSGPVVRESRVKVVPTSGSSQHPQLEVIFDIRSYAAGGDRIDLTVQNVRDAATMDKVPISSVALQVNGAPAWSHGPVTSYSMTRWRKIVWAGASEAAVVPDFAPAYGAGVLPQVLPTVINKTYNTSGANYGLMGGQSPGGFPAFAYGEMNPDMAAGGGREEIGALNWWEAIYLAHRTQNQRQVVLRNADLTGAWSNHLSKPDGTVIKLGDAGYDPRSWWWDGRAPVGARPLAALNPRTNFQGAREGVTSDTDTGSVGVASRYNEEHVPAPMFLAYVISGDRYYVDQAKFWAASAILHSAPGWMATDPVNFPGWFRGRDGATGNERILDFTGMTREFGWPLRLVALSAWMIPDGDSDKTYFVETVQNNLNHVGRYLDIFVRLGYGGALGLIGGIESTSGWSTLRAGQVTGRYTSIWRMNYTAYSVDWATRLGMWTVNPSVHAFVNRVVGLAIKMNVQNAEFLAGKSGLSYPYYPCYAMVKDGVFTSAGFDNFSQLKANNETYQYQDDPNYWCPGWNKNEPGTGYYNTEHHVALQIGIRRGLPDAQAAADRLLKVPGHLSDLNVRAGFAITFSPGSGPSSTPSLPPEPPANVRIIR
jgi:hypothetical protein